MPSTPPTSPQRHQEAARHAERSARLMASPEQRRTPAGPSAASTSALPPPPPPPPPPVAQASTAGSYNHLPPDLAAQWAALLPIPPAPRRGRPLSAGPSAATSAPPPPLPPVHLPANLAAQWAALPPLPPAPRRGRPSSSNLALPPVSLIFILILYI